MQETEARSVSGQSNAGVRKPRKSRGRGLRTTTGCAICRKRHMKCDEVKPVCGPCAKGNRACLYGALPSDVETVDRSSLDNKNAQSRLETSSKSARADTSIASPEHHRSHGGSGHTAATAKRASFSDTIESRPSSTQWPTTPIDDSLQAFSPQSSYSNSTGYGTEVAPLRWFDLLAGDAVQGSRDLPSLESLSDAALAQRYELHRDGVSTQDSQAPLSLAHPSFVEAVALQNPSKLLQISALSPMPLNGSGGSTDERQFWQASEPMQLKDHEFDIFQRFVTGISLWIDLFDARRHFSTLIPHLALYNEGLMKAVLALGARHLSIKPKHSGEASLDRTSAVQYYYETLQYLQSAMRFTSYKNSDELLATVLVVSMYEMIDGAGIAWERHLKGVFWIQRSREINGESGGLEQAVWWAWLRQDVWAAFRENRRCFSFFRPTKSYTAMDMWDMASRVVYILAQAVNYSSKEEKQEVIQGRSDYNQRIMRANTLLNMLAEWRQSISVHFSPLPVEGPSNRAFRPLWIHPPAFGVSLQMYSMARILLSINQPAGAGYLELMTRDKVISECVEEIGGIAMKLTDDASRLMSTQCLFAAGLYSKDPAKRECIAELIQDHQSQTGWPVNTDLAEELRHEWSKTSE